MADDPTPPAALTAAAMIESFRFDAQLAESVVLVFDASLVPRRANARRLRRATHPFRQVGSLDDGVNIVVASGPGSPVAAITVEFLAAFGVRRVIAVGSAGELNPAAGETSPVRTMVVGRAESDEGTSGHYGSDRNANAQLRQSLQQHVGADATVVALSTDVPFRHTPARLAAHRERADVVEMECAALFAAANSLDMAAAALLVSSDRFGRDGWLPNSSAMVRAELQRAVEVAAALLNQAR